MNRIAFIAIGCFAAMQMGAALTASAQTCASPTPIVSTGTFPGNTCTNTNQLPYLANGAISVAGNQDVYFIHAVNAQSVSLTLVPDASVDMALFICRNQCSTYTTCIAAVDAGVAGGTVSAPLPDGPGDYYVIVGSTSAGTCGNYDLNVIAPLND